MKLLRVLCALAIVATFSVAAYAETQSVKVSGDLQVASVLRDAYGLQAHPVEVDGTVGRTNSTSTQTWLMSTTEVQIDADMTDNVSTCVRLANERDWNVQGKATVAATPILTEYDPAGNTNQTEFDVEVDLAYVTLKDFIYSPLTLTVGRQDIVIGKGFIVGSNQRLNGGGTTTNGINAPEFTTYNAFDALKAVLDYNPWTITGIYSKTWENSILSDDDVNLWGTNVGYKFDTYNADAEAYWFYKQDNSVTMWRENVCSNDVHTLGMRGSFDPIDVLTVNLEGAYQFGSYAGSRLQQAARGRSAFAIDASVEWRLFADKYSWKPKVGAEYIFYSGNEPETDPSVADGVYQGWDRMYRGKFDSQIREWVGTYYATNRYPFVLSANRNDPQTGDASYQNQHQVIFMGSLQPIESLTLKGNCNLFWSQESVMQLTAANSYQGEIGHYIGTEVDLEVIWDYTEDVSFGLLSGFFFPGEVYSDNNGTVNPNTPQTDSTASQLLGTVKVSF